MPAGVGGGEDAVEPEERLVDRAAARGVGVYGISRYYLDRPGPAGLMLGYSGMTETEIRDGIRRLGETLR